MLKITVDPKWSPEELGEQFVAQLKAQGYKMDAMTEAWLKMPMQLPSNTYTSPGFAEALRVAEQDAIESRSK